jgi:hypothetical protein
MKTDLDTKLTTALQDLASTTTVSDDALATILRRAEPRSRPPRPRRRVIVAGITVAAVAAGAGAAYAVAHRLSPGQVATVEESRCDLSSENARLVASTTSVGRTVEYWTVDGAGYSADFLFEDGDAFGGGGCGPVSRAVEHPNLPWANYTETTLGDGIGHFVFFGQAPAGTSAVDLVTDAGTTRAAVTAPDGYFVVIATLPVPASDRRDIPPQRIQFQRVDAYAADGTLLGTGGLN